MIQEADVLINAMATLPDAIADAKGLRFCWRWSEGKPQLAKLTAE
jgi:hypothetical protein